MAPAPNGDAEYEISFQRDSQVDPSGTVRADPLVDAIGGYVDVDVDRLARVEVKYGAPTVTGVDADGNETRAPRTYDQLSTSSAAAVTWTRSPSTSPPPTVRPD